MRTCAEAADAVHDVAEGGGLPVLVGAYFAVGAAPAVGPLAFQILTLGSVGLFP
jgi:cytochrome c biogenesis protein CcdA